ncbi:MAG: GNAT family N-acetyltransferase [Nitratireductor sp.]|nr:GNAT family N-acetyltransferase [Nitratireductor sp.]
MRLRLFNASALSSAPIRGNGLVLRLPEPGDYPAWRHLREESTSFLRPWEPRWPTDDLTRTGFRRRLMRYRRDAAENSGFTYFLFDAISGELLGGLSLSNIRMGAARSCSLGYWMGERYAGLGYMRKAVTAVLPHAFGTLGLERIEAGCIPGNMRSIRLLEGLGFQQEGTMRGYLEIDGRRQDHILFAILRQDFEMSAQNAIRPKAAGIGA